MEIAILVIECLILIGLGAFVWVCAKLIEIFGELNNSVGVVMGMFGQKPEVKK